MNYMILDNFGTEPLTFNEMLVIDGGDFLNDVAYGIGYVYGCVEHAVENIIAGASQAAKDRNPNK